MDLCAGAVPAADQSRRGGSPGEPGQQRSWRSVSFCADTSGLKVYALSTARCVTMGFLRNGCSGAKWVTKFAYLAVGWFKSTAPFSVRDECGARPISARGIAMRSKTLWLVLVLATGCFGPKKEGGAGSSCRTRFNRSASGASSSDDYDEDKARKNPVKFTEFSVRTRQEDLRNQCAICHGDKGDGKGELAARHEDQRAGFYQA